MYLAFLVLSFMSHTFFSNDWSLWHLIEWSFFDAFMFLFHSIFNLCQLMFHNLLLLCHAFLHSYLSVVHRLIVLWCFLKCIALCIFIIFIFQWVFSSVICLSGPLASFFVCVFYRSYTTFLLLLFILLTLEFNVFF